MDFHDRHMAHMRVILPGVIITATIFALGIAALQTENEMARVSEPGEPSSLTLPHMAWGVYEPSVAAAAAAF